MKGLDGASRGNSMCESSKAGELGATENVNGQ